MDLPTSQPNTNNFTLKQLNDISKQMLDKGISPNTQILISTADTHIGSRSSVKAIGMHIGFNWEAGQLRIETDEPIRKSVSKSYPNELLKTEFGKVNTAIQELKNILCNDYGIEVYGQIDNLLRELYLKGFLDGQEEQTKEDLSKEDDYER